MRQLLILAIFFLAQTNLQSQVEQEWANTFGTQSNPVYEVSGIAVDNSGNVFVSGSVKGATLSDFLTIKYNSSGAEQWVRTFTGPVEDRIIDMALDNSGNICVTGLSENQTGTYDIITIKYNTQGDSLWVKRYNGENAFTMDQPVAMSIDMNDNIYVSGYSFGTTPMTYVTIKYSPQGDSLWVGRYIAGGTDYPRDIFADDFGNVYVYGRGLRILKYDTNGNLLWNRIYPQDAGESNKLLTCDKQGHIYFGASKFTSTFDDYVTSKINSSGDTLWTRIYNGLGNANTNHDDVAAICVDNAGNVFITGKSYNLSSYFFSTLKYNAEGIFQWERNHSNPQNGEGGKDILTDNSGNVYVTGGSNDYTTIKYNTNGDTMWTMTYDGPAGLMDMPSAIAIDNAGNVYVTGISRQSSGSFGYYAATIKYSQTITGINPNNDPVTGYELFQNYPNPFNPDTRINYRIPENIDGSSFVKIVVFDASGKEAATLTDQRQYAGSYSIDFNAVDLPSGVYFYSLFIDNTLIDTKKSVLLK